MEREEETTRRSDWGRELSDRMIKCMVHVEYVYIPTELTFLLLVVKGFSWIGMRKSESLVGESLVSASNKNG